MTDGRYYGYLTFIYRPCDTLVVKSEKVLIRTSAPCNDDDINILLFIEIIDAVRNLRRAVLALNARRLQEQINVRISLP